MSAHPTSQSSGTEDPVLLAYPDGSHVKEGDWVKMEQGKVLGRISEVVASREQAETKKLQGPGVVVDAPPKGLVFLSEQIMREDPLHFVRHGPSEKVRMWVALALGLGVLMALPALFSLISAIHQAATTGEVLVISLGRTATARETVPWPQGWARFVGPVVLIASLCTFDGSRGVSARWWLAGTGVALGLWLLAFSRWFATVNGTLVLMGLHGFLALAFFVDRKFGRAPALGVIIAGAALAVWAVAA